jgi:quercetin dioxygenase-like cupin family protein
MPDGAAPAAAQVEGDSVTALLLARWPVERYLVEVYRAALAERVQESTAHAPGVLETVTVVRGRVLAGCAGDERELAEGESLRYRGDLPHRFAALGAPAGVILLMHYPSQESTEGTIADDR